MRAEGELEGGRGKRADMSGIVDEMSQRLDELETSLKGEADNSVRDGGA